MVRLNPQQPTNPQITVLWRPVFRSSGKGLDLFCGDTWRRRKKKRQKGLEEEKDKQEETEERIKEKPQVA